jgi:hypothetical protein
MSENSRITITLSPSVKKIVDDMAEEEGKSCSRMCSDLIDRGLTQSNIQLTIREVGLKNNKYLIQILNIVGEMFYKIHGKRSGEFEKGTSPKDMLDQISQWASNLSNANFRD